MIKNINVKKELTEQEFKELLIGCGKKFDHTREINTVLSECESKTKEIIPANEAYVLLPDTENKAFNILSLDKTLPMQLEKSSIITECYNTKQALIVNDVSHSFLYNEACDNILDINIMSLLVVPVLDDQNDQEVLALIWAAIPKGQINQYTQKDIDYMSRFSILIKKFLQNKVRKNLQNTFDTEFDDCMEAYDKLSAKIRREQEYFSNIIHDIRTPMNGVIGFLELLKLNEENPQKKEYIQTALKSAADMVALISDALDISKMSSGKMSIENTEFSPFEELSDIAKLFYNSARNKGIVLDAYFDPKIPAVIKSDYHRIKQIINNLLNNAIKFTPNKGNIFLELLYDRTKDGLTISVKDSGIGIAKEKQKLIFTPYAQEKSSTAREFGGTGLGLSISQQLSVLLGGRMELESQEGKGSKFYFTIPCNTPVNTPAIKDDQRIQSLNIVVYSSKHRNTTTEILQRYLKAFHIVTQQTTANMPLGQIRDDKPDMLIILEEDTAGYEEEIQLMLDQGLSVIIIEEPKLQEEHNWYVGKLRKIRTPLLPNQLYDTMLALSLGIDSEEEKTVLDPESLQGKRFLIVDDSEINLKVMREILKVYHIETVTAMSGEESIEKFIAEKPDMIFMDRNMPGMLGDEAIEIIRKTEKESKAAPTVIIGLTGDADKTTKEEMLKIGADDVLTKPVQLDKLTGVIMKYIK